MPSPETANSVEIERALRVFLSPGQVLEARALDKPGYKGSRQKVAGYFDNPGRIRQFALENRSAPVIDFSPNPVDPELLARANNVSRKIYRGDPLTTEVDIPCRRWFALCFDPVRKLGVSSTDAEHQGALDLAEVVSSKLHAVGWPAPILADSGNGADLIFRIDLRPDDRELIEDVCGSIAQEHETAEIKIHGSSDACFYLPLYGTVARIGSSVPDRPHRLTKLITIPENPEPVPVDLLESCAAQCPRRNAAALDAEVGDESGAATTPVYSLPDLLRARFDEPTPLVESLIYQGETVLIVGRPKQGKSRLVAQLAISLSRGEPFLGKRVPRKFRVLLLDLENRPSIASSRFKKMCQPHPDDENVLIVAPEFLAGVLVGLEGDGLESLKGLVNEYKPDVLIVDTWRLLIGPVDENKSEEVLNGLRALSNLKMIVPGLTLILVHHLRKQTTNGTAVTLREDPYSWVESVSGHHALVGHVDCCFGLEREPDQQGNELIVFGGVARNTTSSTMLLEEDPETLLFAPAEGADALVSVLTAVESRIWESARRLRQFTFGQLVGDAKTTNKKAVTSMLRKAEAQHALNHEADRYEVII